MLRSDAAAASVCHVILRLAMVQHPVRRGDFRPANHPCTIVKWPIVSCAFKGQNEATADAENDVDEGKPTLRLEIAVSPRVTDMELTEACSMTPAKSTLLLSAPSKKWRDDESLEKALL